MILNIKRVHICQLQLSKEWKPFFCSGITETQPLYGSLKRCFEYFQTPVALCISLLCVSSVLRKWRGDVINKYLEMATAVSFSAYKRKGNVLSNGTIKMQDINWTNKNIEFELRLRNPSYLRNFKSGDFFHSVSASSGAPYRSMKRAPNDYHQVPFKKLWKGRICHCIRGHLFGRNPENVFQLMKFCTVCKDSKGWSRDPSQRWHSYQVIFQRSLFESV